MKKTKKLLLYSHDTFGLGHIRRTQKIANKLASDDKSILIACASPKASSFMSSEGIEYLNLPGFTKQKSGQYIPRSLNIPTDEFVNLRATLLLSTVRSFHPDIVLIDKEPLGVKRELLPALEYLKRHRSSCKIICGFRDILDEKKAIDKEWKKRDNYNALKSYFDHAFVYGDQSLFDFGKEYGLDQDIISKLVYTGYLSFTDQLIDNEIFKTKSSSSQLITFTLGGGGDGWEFLECFLNYLSSSEFNHSNKNYFVLTGPFANQKLIKDALSLAQANENITASDFISSAPTLFHQSDLVISMGGYNTFCELISLGKKPLILPRIIPRKEQLIRAQVFKEKGLCDYIHPDDLSPQTLDHKINLMLSQPKPPQNHLMESGLDNVSKWINQWLKEI